MSTESTYHGHELSTDCWCEPTVETVPGVDWEAKDPSTEDDDMLPDDLLSEAWRVISNSPGWESDEGDTKDDEWRQAAIRWRDRWHATLPAPGIIEDDVAS